MNERIKMWGFFLVEYSKIGALVGAILLAIGISVFVPIHMAKRAKAVPISHESGVPGGIIVKTKTVTVDDNQFELIYTSQQMIYAVSLTYFRELRLPILGHRVTELPRGFLEISLRIEGQQILVPGYHWNE